MPLADAAMFRRVFTPAAGAVFRARNDLTRPDGTFSMKRQAGHGLWRRPSKIVNFHQDNRRCLHYIRFTNSTLAEESTPALGTIAGRQTHGREPGCTSMS